MPQLPAKKVRTLALDTETAGLDVHRGAGAFFVSACWQDDPNEPLFWEWPVDPLTRRACVDDGDVGEIVKLVEQAQWLVFQNGKYDIQVLAALGIEWRWWDRTHDTILAGHLLASGQPHNLTDMALLWLGKDISGLEKELGKVTNKARDWARRHRPAWKIAEKHGEDTPSAKDTVWKYDMWLPRAVAAELDYPEGHPWWTALRDYALADASITAQLFEVQLAEIRRRGLEAIYNERLKVTRPTVLMERRGVTLSGVRTEELLAKYRQKSINAADSCVKIAALSGRELVLPKSGNNDSLLSFCFGRQVKEGGKLKGYEPDPTSLMLPVVKRTDAGNPSLDNKDSIPAMLLQLPERSRGALFLRALQTKRQVDTAISFLEGYKRLWVPLGIFNDKGEQLWFRIHPSFNATGTATLRWSSNNPNGQNASKKENFNLRYTFGPAPGREWWAFDFENIELRIPAYGSKEPDLMALFERPDDPPYYGSQHLLNFSAVYPDIWEKELAEVGYDKVGPHCKSKYKATQYQWCKNGDFAIAYGCQEATADRTFRKKGAFRLLKERFAKMEEYNQHWIRFANKHGYVETMPDKTVDPTKGYPVECTRGDWGRISPTIPLNYHVQSTAMQCTTKAMPRCQDLLDEWNDAEGLDQLTDGYATILQVHDELDFDFPAGDGPEPWQRNKDKAARIKAAMERSGDDIGVPLRVSVEYHGQNWSEGIKIKC